tara:strand:- start:957 stop:1178 length:222 start_codon:yes stop_codon:yes gene_type:complete
MSNTIRTDLSIKEINSLLDALYDSELLNLHRKRKGHQHKAENFLRVGNQPVNTAFDKLLKMRSLHSVVGVSDE